MVKLNADDPPVRKTLALPQSWWAEVTAYRIRGARHGSGRIATETEALRDIIQAGIQALKSGSGH